MIVMRWCALLLSLFLLGCFEDTTPYQTESPVTYELSKFSNEGPKGARLRLADATDFSWDSVVFFLEGTRKSEINQILESSFFSDDSSRFYEPGALLVFQERGKVVHAVVILPPLFLSGLDREVYPIDEAVVVAASKESPFALRLGE